MCGRKRWFRVSSPAPGTAAKQNRHVFSLYDTWISVELAVSTFQAIAMNSKWLRAAFLSLTLTAPVLAEPVVKLDKSKVAYRGVARDSVEDFHNIKFAHDTAGQRRFAPPEPYSPPAGSEIDGTSHGPACPQFQAAIPPFFDETPDISEDCLHLRITRPAGTTENDRLPVVVHLVGGGVIKGFTYDSHIDPKNLITHSMSLGKPVIVSCSAPASLFSLELLADIYLTTARCPELPTDHLRIRSPPNTQRSKIPERWNERPTSWFPMGQR